jgi:hypothetical protein
VQPVQAAAVWWLDDVLHALTAKAMVAKEDLELVVENGYDHVVLEVDYRGLQALLRENCRYKTPNNTFHKYRTANIIFVKITFERYLLVFYDI